MSEPQTRADHVANLRAEVDRLQGRLSAIELEHETLTTALRAAEIAWAREAGWPHCDVISRRYRVQIPEADGSTEWK
ncbi:MAG TPA: hypothetical protein VHX66_00270 [Solirubrobacteraceae bacterium]|jgi:hypothetical protein|nr:hypothetical protein [Solirubrobacteraceae bacterium]